MANLAIHHDLSGMSRQSVNLVPEGRRRLIELVPLLHRGALDLMRLRGKDHGRA